MTGSARNMYVVVSTFGFCLQFCIVLTWCCFSLNVFSILLVNFFAHHRDVNACPLDSLFFLQCCDDTYASTDFCNSDLQCY